MVRQVIWFEKNCCVQFLLQSNVNTTDIETLVYHHIMFANLINSLEKLLTNLNKEHLRRIILYI